MDGSSEYQVGILIAIGTAGMLILAIAIILFMVFYQKKMIQEQLKQQQLEYDYQQKMMLAELESQENERRRLAADLHDSIGGMLSAIRVGLSTLSKQQPEVTGFDQAKQMLDETISSVRRISRDLMPSTLERFGLSQALQEMCDRFAATTNIPINFQEQGIAFPLEKSKALMLFRITQELLNNAIKHAQASVLEVTKLNNSHAILITVEDDGVGFDPQVQKRISGKGLGLFGMENRAHLIGAELHFEKGSTGGTKITVTLPQQHDSKA